jgi:hypothetical protein
MLIKFQIQNFMTNYSVVLQLLHRDGCGGEANWYTFHCKHAKL